MSRFRRRRPWIRPTPAPQPVPVPAPTTPAPVVTGTTVPSSMPMTSLSHWKLKAAEDFLKPAKLGELKKIYGEEFRGYDKFTDTSGNGTYAPDKVVTVADSILNFNLHVENGKPLVACILPFGYAPQLYGRYSLKVRASSNEPGFKIAFMLWPSSDNWDQGEIDFPESDLPLINPTKEHPQQTVRGFNHRVGDPKTNSLSTGSETNLLDWHVYTIEWSPGRLSLYIDGKLLDFTTDGVPDAPMRLTLQAETALDNKPPVVPGPNTWGNVQVDWAVLQEWVK